MTIFNNVATILSELSSAENIHPQQKLRDELGLDSIRMVSLLIMLEEKFNIVLDESDMNPFDLIDVNNVISLVKKYVGGDNNEKES